jgi:hypothetical protein
MEAFLAAKLLEAVGVPDQAELPFAYMTSFDHDTRLAIFPIRFRQIFCITATI